MFEIDSRYGSLQQISGSPLVASHAVYSIAMNPNGAFAYVSGADSNTVTAYAVNPITGKLTASTAAPPGTTDTEPLCVAVDTSGRFAYTANYVGEDVSAFTLDPATGALTAVGAPFKAGVATQAIAIMATIQ